MKKCILLALVAMVFAACDQISPEQQQLIGTWHEPYHVNATVKSLTFNGDGTLIYSDKPDTTSIPVIDWAGDYATLQYAVEKNNLSIFGKREVYDGSGHAAYENFKYTTSYTFEGNLLVIDSFAYDGGVNSMFRPLKLEKQ